MKPKLIPARPRRLPALAARLGLVSLLLLAQLLPAAGSAPAYAQDGGGDESGSGEAGAGQALVDAIYAIARVFIRILVFSGAAIFAASLARGAFAIQLANLIGSPMAQSQAVMAVIGAVFAFLFALMSMYIVDLIFVTVRGFVDTSFTIPAF